MVELGQGQGGHTVPPVENHQGLQLTDVRIHTIADLKLDTFRGEAPLFKPKKGS